MTPETAPPDAAGVDSPSKPAPPDPPNEAWLTPTHIAAMGLMLAVLVAMFVLMMQGDSMVEYYQP